MQSVSRLLKNFSKISAKRQQLRRLNHFDIFNSASNKRPETEFDFDENNVGLFRIAQLSTPNGFSAIKEIALKKSEQLVGDAEKAEAGAEAIKLADEAAEKLHRTADLARFIATHHPEEMYRNAADEARLSVASAIERLNGNEKLLERLELSALKVDEELRHVANLMLAGYRSKISICEMKKTTSELYEELAWSMNKAIIESGPTSLETWQPNELMYSVDPYIRDKVRLFLGTLNNKLEVISNCSADQLNSLKVKDTHIRNGKSDKIEAWRFYATKLKKSNRCQIECYFSLSDCMRGVSRLFESLYGVKLQPEVAESKGELWNESVVKVAVVNSNTGVIVGHVYCDFYGRENKPYYDCNHVVDGGRSLSDCCLPKVVVSLNLDPPSASKPALLDSYSLSCLFHEMGKAVHSIVNKPIYFTECTTDYSEVPAVLMEHFARDPRVLKTFARHYRTGKAIGKKVLRLISESYKDEQLAQMQLKYDPVADKVRNVSDVWYDPLYGTQAKHYANQLVSRAVASRLWNKLFRKDPFDSKAAQAYRKVAGEGNRKAYEGLLGEKLCADDVVRILLEDFCSNCGFRNAVTWRGTDLNKIKFKETDVDLDRIYG